MIFVEGQTRMPAVTEAVIKLFNNERYKSINPDEVVSLGATVQAGVLQGDVKDVLLLDVIPLSLGIETLGGVATKLIERNTTIPTTRSQVFSTAADNQTSVEIHITQGERPMASDNKTLGRFILDAIPPAPRGMPQVEVSFDVDANGILNVKAKDKASGKEQSIKIEASSGLTDEDIKKMREEAEINAEEDMKKKELVDQKNTAEMMIFTAEKSLKDYGDKVPEETKKSIENKIEEVKKAKEGSDVTAIKMKLEEMTTELSKIGEIIAKENKDKGEESTATEVKEEQIKDAEVKEEDEEKDNK